MAVHGYRPADGEGGIALHDLYRLLVPIDAILNRPPCNAGLNADDAIRWGIGDDAVHAPHVEVQGFGRGDLATHAEPAATDRQRPRPCLDGLLHFVRRRRPKLACHGNRIEAGDVVDRSLSRMLPVCLRISRRRPGKRNRLQKLSAALDPPENVHRRLSKARTACRERRRRTDGGRMPASLLFASASASSGRARLA